MKTLIDELYNSNKMRLFEIELGNGEYYMYHIEAGNGGLYAGGMTNNGFIPYEQLFVAWDADFGLDWHIEYLYELCLEDAMKNGVCDDN